MFIHWETATEDLEARDCRVPGIVYCGRIAWASACSGSGFSLARRRQQGSAERSSLTSLSAHYVPGIVHMQVLGPS